MREIFEKSINCDELCVHTKLGISVAIGNYGQIGVHKSTISRELKRNLTYVRTALGSWQYKPDYAQKYTEDRRKRKPKRIKFTKDVEQCVCEKIIDEWSQEQISGYAKRHKLFSISHERIYQFILADKEKGGQLYKQLRHQHKKYCKRYFAHPYHSWERGLNENTNGLIRQYIPKGKDFADLSDADIITIQEKLNSRPRKSLGFATPNEVFEKLQKKAS